MEREQDIISLEAAPTLAHAFHELVLRTPDQVAWRDWRDWRDGRWTDHTWAESQAEVALWQHAMQADGLQPGERIAILCSNRWEWVLCDQAAQGLGLVSVPLYTNDRAENIGWILKDAGVRWLFLEKAEHWERLQEIRDRLGTLTRIVTGERVEDELPNVIDLDAWLTPARTLPTPPEYVLDPGAPGSLATIVYTSGTTGRPKGMMLCHHNILWDIHAALQQVPVYPQDMLLSFLPLSHTLERTAGYYLPIVAGTPVTFSRGIPQLADDLAMVKPTLMISVPRIFERVYGRISAKVDEGSVLKQWLFHEAVKLGWRRFEWQQGRARWTPGLLLHAPAARPPGRSQDSGAPGRSPALHRVWRCRPGRGRSAAVHRSGGAHSARLWAHRDQPGDCSQHPGGQPAGQRRPRPARHRGADGREQRTAHPQSGCDARLLEQPRGHRAYHR